MRRQRRRVRRLHDRHLAQPRLQRSCRVAPQQAHERPAAGCQRIDGALGDGLPALAAVRVRHPGLHRQHPVEQQHALIGPAAEVAVLCRRVAEVVRQLGVDVAQARRQRPVLARHREAEAHRLAGRGIGILSDQQHAYVRQRPLEGAQHPVAGGLVAAPGSQLGAQEVAHPRDVGLHRRERVGPVGGHQTALDEACERAHEPPSDAAARRTTGSRSRATACCSTAKGCSASASPCTVSMPLIQGSSAQTSCPREGL